MAPIGFLIKHRDLKGCTATVSLPFAPMVVPKTYGQGGKCPLCNTMHPFKTYHLDLTSDGTCIVSRRVFDNLCAAGAIDGVPKEKLAKRTRAGKKIVVKPLAVPFVFVSEVEPPPLFLGAGRRGTVVDGDGRVLRSSVAQVVRVHGDST